MNKIQLSPTMYFSYNQFMVYDETHGVAGLAWTDALFNQGFARTESGVAFGTLLEFGHADVTVTMGAYQNDVAYERVIGVPFHVRCGKVIINATDEVRVKRAWSLPPGHYRLVAAQSALAEDKERIDLFFETVKEPTEVSSVILADAALKPAYPLVKFAESAKF